MKDSESVTMYRTIDLSVLILLTATAPNLSSPCPPLRPDHDGS
eukprot:CAMPEP_0173400750 /NCGR_PEP_ID=MMETSP1356-20130122/48813_1 /TAXON_ID=77927 ORGANISM="Hemiselmis virescens, Strain PCC157" /NCGR_SAMPLE_ID=MMETSP1356 /ASSEMBLY_ACC=CAM_ASM_000847 /LENGTH=42 /DNA_ID= /DNA_START= /DNA_END= /DNA_ORIENTATION=